MTRETWSLAGAAILASCLLSGVAARAATFSVHNPAEFQTALDQAAANGEADTIQAAGL